jgi:glc operon protein GlcG
MTVARSSFFVFAAALLLVNASHAKSAESEGTPDLVRRDRVELTLEGAELIMKQAQAKARSIGKNVNIAIVDNGGHPVLFARMNQARPASSYTATTKAIAAATLRAPTGPFKNPAGEADTLLNLALQNAAGDAGGRMTSLFGGVPIVVEGQVIGAVGVGGGTGEEDAEIAKAGIEALLKKLD